MSTNAKVLPQPTEPAMLPDVTTAAHPSASDDPLQGNHAPEVGGKNLQEVLPEINKLAQKVGGFKKLADIADDLNETGS